MLQFNDPTLYKAEQETSRKIPQRYSPTDTKRLDKKQKKDTKSFIINHLTADF